MKQHITTEQLNELSKNQKDKLDVWFSRHPYTYTIRAVSKIGETGFKNTDPLLTIGQMIEFLDGQRVLVDFLIQNFNTSLEWLIILDEHVLSRENELCDALWEAVKEVLQDEKKT